MAMGEILEFMKSIWYRQIMNLFEGKTYKVYLGNEEIGDPEVTE